MLSAGGGYVTGARMCVVLSPPISLTVNDVSLCQQRPWLLYTKARGHVTMAAATTAAAFVTTPATHTQHLIFSNLGRSSFYQPRNNTAGNRLLLYLTKM